MFHEKPLNLPKSGVNIIFQYFFSLLNVFYVDVYASMSDILFGYIIMSKIF